MAEFEVYHTTENRGNELAIQSEGGIYADSKNLFLGKGYYYWEGSFDCAREWGFSRYNGKFVIFKGYLALDMDFLLDLSTNSHNRFLKELYKRFKNQYRGKKRVGELYVGLFIDFVRELQNDCLKAGQIDENECFFPFKYSKLVDHSASKKSEKQGVSASAHHWYWSNPVVIICVYEKNDLILKDFQVVKST